MTTLAINKLWANYPLSPEIVEMTLKNRKNVSDDIDETLYSAMEEKYRLRFFYILISSLIFMISEVSFIILKQSSLI